MKNALPIIILVLLLVLGGWYAITKNMHDAITSGTEPVVVDYVCRNGAVITAVFTEGTPVKPTTPDTRPIPTGSVALTLSKGGAVTLPQTISADGTRYANADDSFVFWSKGNGAIVLEQNQEKTYQGCVMVAPSTSLLPQVFTDPNGMFSIRMPSGYTIDPSYKNQQSPTLIISGVKFTIPSVRADGTNLAHDSYVSVEQLPNQSSCTADKFFDGTHTPMVVTEGTTDYSVATSLGAGAGNRYEETVYAFPGSNPCMAIRYLVHYSVIQNYDPGTVTEFDSVALMKEFDAMRKTFILNQ